MRGRAFGWFRWAVQTLLNAVTASPSYANSTLVPASNTGTADGSTGNTLTLTVRDSDNALMGLVGVTFTTELTAVSASQSTLVDDAAEIAATTGTLFLTLTARNAAGVALPNIQTARIVFSSTGTGNTFTPLDSATSANGTYHATFSSTVSEAKTLSVTVDGVAITQTAAVTVTGGAPGLPTIDWFSDYSTGVGTTSTQINDGGKWNGTISNIAGLEVVNAAGDGVTGWPSANALKVTGLAANDGFHRVTKTGFTVPAEGASVWFRWYFNMRWDFGLGDNSNHPIEAPDTGAGEEWTWLGQHISAGVWRVRLRSSSNEDQFDPALTYVEGPNLAINTTYRFELQIQRLTGDEFQMHHRIYSADGSLFASDADFIFANGSGNLSSNPTFHFASVTGANLAGLWNGTNGLGNPGTWGPTRLYAYQGSFAHSLDTWCGAYDAVNG